MNFGSCAFAESLFTSVRWRKLSVGKSDLFCLALLFLPRFLTQTFCHFICLRQVFPRILYRSVYQQALYSLV